MSYTKNTWTSGDVITSTKLNNMENGIENASTSLFIVNAQATIHDETMNAITDKSFTEIESAIQSGLYPILYIYSGEDLLLTLPFNSYMNGENLGAMPLNTIRFGSMSIDDGEATGTATISMIEFTLTSMSESNEGTVSRLFYYVQLYNESGS